MFETSRQDGCRVCKASVAPAARDVPAPVPVGPVSAVALAALPSPQRAAAVGWLQSHGGNAGIARLLAEGGASAPPRPAIAREGQRCACGGLIGPDGQCDRCRAETRQESASTETIARRRARDEQAAPAAEMCTCGEEAGAGGQCDRCRDDAPGAVTPAVGSASAAPLSLDLPRGDARAAAAETSARAADATAADAAPVPPARAHGPPEADVDASMPEAALTHEVTSGVAPRPGDPSADRFASPFAIGAAFGAPVPSSDALAAPALASAPSSDEAASVLAPTMAHEAVTGPLSASGRGATGPPALADDLLDAPPAPRAADAFGALALPGAPLPAHGASSLGGLAGAVPAAVGGVATSLPAPATAAPGASTGKTPIPVEAILGEFEGLSGDIAGRGSRSLGLVESARKRIRGVLADLGAGAESTASACGGEAEARLSGESGTVLGAVQAEGEKAQTTTAARAGAARAAISEETQAMRAEGTSALDGGLAQLNQASAGSGSSILGRIGSVISAAASSITGWVSRSLGDAASALHGYGGRLLGAVSGLASGVLARIEEVAGQVAGAARSVVTRAVSLLQGIVSAAKSTLASMIAAARRAVNGWLAQAAALVERVLSRVAAGISSAVAQALAHVREARAQAESRAAGGCRPEALAGLQQRRAQLRGELDAALTDHAARGIAPADQVVSSVTSAVGAVVSAMTSGGSSLVTATLGGLAGVRSDAAGEIHARTEEGNDGIAGARSSLDAGRNPFEAAVEGLRNAPARLVGRITQVASTSQDGDGASAPGPVALDLPPVTAFLGLGPSTGTPTPGPLRPPVWNPNFGGPTTKPVVEAGKKLFQTAAEQAPKMAGEAGTIGMVEGFIIFFAAVIAGLIVGAIAVMLGWVTGEGRIELPSWRKDPVPAPPPSTTPKPAPGPQHVPDKKEGDDDEDCRSCGPGTTNIDYGTLDRLGRATGVRARLKGIPDPGTPANPAIEPSGWTRQVRGGRRRARAHLLGKELGGSGDERRNLVTFDQDANTEMFNKWEARVIGAAVERFPVCLTYVVFPVYDHDDLIPYRIEATLKDDCTGVLILSDGIDNRLVN